MRSIAVVMALLPSCGEPPVRHPEPAPAPSPTPASTRSPTPVASAALAPSPTSACAGPSLDLLAVIANADCHVSEDEASQLRTLLEDAARTPLRVEATRHPDGRVLVRVVNTGTAPVELPLLVHSLLENFPVRAGKKMLSRPEPAWPSGFSFGVGRTLVKLGLPPGGKAEAVIRIDETVVTHELRNCPPNAKCSPTTVEHGRLPRGSHELSIRTPLYSIREDLAAKLSWVVQ